MWGVGRAFRKGGNEGAYSGVGVVVPGVLGNVSVQCKELVGSG